MESNYVGLNAAGTAAVPATPAATQQDLNTDVDGAQILDNRFGGAPVVIGGDGSTFQGNVVGVGVGGQDVGIDGYPLIVNSDNNQIGGTGAGEPNTIGNQTGGPFAAVGIYDQADGNVIEGNFIGTDALGGSHPNEGAGIEIGAPSSTDTADDTVIGGDIAAEENVISNNGTDAIRVNRDGSDGNLILRNRGGNNGGGFPEELFIDLIGTNGEGNGAAGPNEGIAAPPIGSAGTTMIAGTSSEPDGTQIHVYQTFTRYGDVKAFVAEGTVTAGAWAVGYPSPLAGGQCISATQTNPLKGTSELAPPVAVGAQGGPCDRIRPNTILRGIRRNRRRGRVTIRFSANEPDVTFRCRLDRRYRRCRSPKTYRRLAPGRHIIRIKAVDQAGNHDRSPLRLVVPGPPRR
jgi:hypothetical protein